MGKMVLSTVKGDAHDIGKNLVAVMLRGAGIDVIDLGVGISPEGFVEGTKEQLEAFARDCIDTAAAKSAYILSSGCQFPENAPLENVLHLLEYACQYGRYDRLRAS
jgi:hypothetical protein